jgi:hypothetical protein
MFAGEVDELFEELLFHEWQVDFHAQSALQTGFEKEKIAAAASGSLSGGKRPGEQSGASTICPLNRNT